MTIILNRCYGGFHIPEAFARAHGLDEYDDIERTDPELVEFVQSHGGRFEEGCACLCAVSFPEGVTDWEIDEYDGYERMTYVLDGKLGHC